MTEFTRDKFEEWLTTLGDQRVVQAYRLAERMMVEADDTLDTAYQVATAIVVAVTLEYRKCRP